MYCARSHSHRLMQMHRRALLRLMQRRLFHALSLYFAMSTIFFLLDVDLFCFPCSFAFALFCNARLTCDLTEAWKRKTWTLRRLRPVVWSLHLRWRLPRRLLTESSEAR